MKCHGNVKKGGEKKQGAKKITISVLQRTLTGFNWYFYINTPKWQKVTRTLKLFFYLTQGND